MHGEMRNNYGEHLKTLRAIFGMTQRELSDATGVERGILRGIETGKRRPNYSQRDKLKRYFGLRLNEIF